MDDFKLLIIEIVLVSILIPLFIYIYNRFSRVKLDKKYSLTKSLNLNHSLIEDNMKWSYGQVQFNINFINKSKNNKIIKIKELEFETVNYELIEFDNIIFDYTIKFENGSFIGRNEKIDRFYLYIINNGTSQSKSENLLISVFGDEKLLFNKTKEILLSRGEIQEAIQVSLNDHSLIDNFNECEYKNLILKITYKDITEEIRIKFSNGKFVYSSPQLGAGSGVTSGNIIDLVINKNEKNYNYEPLKIEKDSSEKLKIKVFSENSASFDFIIHFKRKVIKERVTIKVPVYNIINYESKLLPFSSFSEFMLKNNIKKFELSDSLIDTSSLYFYRINNYLEKQNQSF
ncbi:hypothetical protein ERX27_09855 [Macrococcus brunensis]|uniref:Uncharacterized protein n=1 Tax=Macrococcus brunensis TaxID=198483 RepID=A0A4R6BB33_9STAP|nr:hypothetical protein [Macrococcus brunensis]TDL94172.1 hypothetical protein ERX27_09855 [Macrococcus brunensis]